MDTVLIRGKTLKKALMLILFINGDNRAKAARLVGVSALSFQSWLDETHKPNVKKQQQIVRTLSTIVNQLNARGDEYAAFATGIIVHLKLAGTALLAPEVQDAGRTRNRPPHNKAKAKSTRR
jgi:hypothetical protein